MSCAFSCETAEPRDAGETADVAEGLGAIIREYLILKIFTVCEKRLFA